ncbi:MAG: hypothetical protein OXH49_11135 [Gemmatimonadetes bacterium]|nr:hypothetical protein [Gemmatimonadota bacterium]
MHAHAKWTVLAAAALAVSGRPADAQDSGRLTGGFAGRTDSEMLWSPPVETALRSGFLAGAFVDVPTPVSWLRMRAEGGLAQRGGFVSTDTRGNAVDGEVRGDYLGVHIEAKAGLSLGPVHAFTVAGPVIDYLLRNREDPVLAQVLIEERGTVLGVAAGAGLGLRVTRAWVIEAETRWVRGLTEAYSGSGLQVRNRSREWVLRLSRMAGDSG